MYGTLVSPKTLPASTYSIDEQRPASINATGNVPHFPSTTTGPLAHVPFYKSPILPHGQHTLHVNVNVKSNQTFFFDYLAVEVDDAAASVGAVVIDDRDPDVVYTGPWEHPTPLLLEYNTTSSRANTGLNLTASYTFVGNAIAVYGTVQGDYGSLPIMKCTLDPPANATAGPDAQTHARTDVFSNIGSVPQLRHLRFCLFENLEDVPGKNKGEHKIVLSSLPEALRPWRFDQLVYIPVGSPLLLNATGATVAGDHPDGTSSMDSTEQPQSRRTPAIVAGVVSGIAILALLGAIFFWCRRKRRKGHMEHGGNRKLDSSTPYVDSSGVQMSLSSNNRTDGAKGATSSPLTALIREYS